MRLHKQFKLKNFVDFIYGNQFFLKSEDHNSTKYLASIFKIPERVSPGLHAAHHLIRLIFLACRNLPVCNR